MGFRVVELGEVGGTRWNQGAKERRRGSLCGLLHGLHDLLNICTGLFMWLTRAWAASSHRLQSDWSQRSASGGGTCLGALLAVLREVSIAAEVPVAIVRRPGVVLEVTDHSPAFFAREKAAAAQVAVGDGGPCTNVGGKEMRY